MQVHIRQCHARCLFRIFEADIVKINRAVFHLFHGIFGAGKVAFFAQHLYNALGRFHGHGDHDKHHGKRHQAHQNLEAVGEDGRHLAHGHLGAPAGDDNIRAEREHKGHACIDAELHQGVVEGHDALGAGEIPADVFRRGGKLLFLILFPHIAFYHAHSLHIFLHRIVQRIVFAEHPAENGRGRADNQHQANTQQRNGDQENHGQAPAHGKAHNKGKNEHQRPADCHTDDHHERHLHVHHVRGHAGNQAGHRELVDVLERVILNTVKHIPAQVACKTGGRRGAGVAGCHAEYQGQNGQNQQLNAVVYNDIHAAAGLHLVYQVGDDERDDALQNYLNRHQKRR